MVESLKATVKDYTKLMVTDEMVEYVLEKYRKNWNCEDEIADVILEDLWLKYEKYDKEKGKEAEHDHVKVNKVCMPFNFRHNKILNAQVDVQPETSAFRHGIRSERLAENRILTVKDDVTQFMAEITVGFRISPTVNYEDIKGFEVVVYDYYENALVSLVVW
ncbi:hypothetical protein Tco_1474604 [Tanacetum coccineum]